MKRVTILMSRNERLAFIQKLHTKYNIAQKDVDGVANITTMGVGYLSLRISSNETLILEFLSDNPDRYGSGKKILESYIKGAEGVIVSNEIPEVFKPHLDKEKIVFDYKNDTDLSELMEIIIATPTPSEAETLAEELTAPVASFGVLTTLLGLFKTNRSTVPDVKLQSAQKPRGGVQDWQNNDTTKNDHNAGSTFRPHSGYGNDDL